jgi:hypothetical protein
MGGGLSNEAYDIIEVSDGTIVFTGEAYDNFESRYSTYLVKLNSDGEFMWAKKYENVDRYRGFEAHSVVECLSGGFVLSGFKEISPSPGSYNMNFFLIRTDANGEVLWEGSYGGTGIDNAASVVETSDAGFLLAGATNSDSHGGQDAYLVKTDATGVQEWDLRLGGTLDDEAVCVIETSDDGYVMAGYTDSFGDGDRDIYMAKTDSEGTIIWEKWHDAGSMTGSDSASSIIETLDGGLMVTGHVGADIYLLKTDSTGTFLWEQWRNGASPSYAEDLAELPNGDILVVGYVDPYGTFEKPDGFVARIDTDLNDQECTGTLLPPPEDLQAQAISSATVHLTWTDASGEATTFAVERYSASPDDFVQIAVLESAETEFFDTGLSPDTTYSYRVRTNNDVGLSLPSEEVQVTTGPPTVPLPPSDLWAGVLSAQSIHLSWTDLSDNESGFSIERSLSEAAGFQEVGSSSAGSTTFDDTGLSEGETYFYRVRAFNDVGNSAYSANAVVDVSTPNVPSDLTAEPDVGFVQLSWSDGTRGEQGFRVQRGTTESGPFDQEFLVDANSTTFKDTDIELATTYYYRVQAYNGMGDSGYSNVAEATTLEYSCDDLVRIQIDTIFNDVTIYFDQEGGSSYSISCYGSVYNSFGLLTSKTCSYTFPSGNLYVLDHTFMYTATGAYSYVSVSGDVFFDGGGYCDVYANDVR